MGLANNASQALSLMSCIRQHKGLGMINAAVPALGTLIITRFVLVFRSSLGQWFGFQ